MEQSVQKNILKRGLNDVFLYSDLEDRKRLLFFTALAIPCFNACLYYLGSDLSFKTKFVLGASLNVGYLYICFETTNLLLFNVKERLSSQTVPFLLLQIAQFFLSFFVGLFLGDILVKQPILKTPAGDYQSVLFSSLMFALAVSTVLNRLKKSANIVDENQEKPVQSVRKASMKSVIGKSAQLWNDQDDRLQNIILFTIAIIFGPVLNFVMLQNLQWAKSMKLNLTVVIYISALYIFFSIYDRLIALIMRLVFRAKPRPNFWVEFVKFYLTWITAGLYQYIFVYEPVLNYQRPQSISIVLVTVALYSLVAAAIFYRFKQMKDIALKSKVAQAEAQYSMLESQMQPHFLFNSLNVLSELIYVDPDQANAMAQKMADLYREILNNSKAKFSTLGSEVAILKMYVDIQKIRFGDRIRFHSHVDPAFYNLQIPSLMLQTLVENAIKHGISPKQEGGEIDLSVNQKGNMYEVCISNTGKLYEGHKESRRSTGLQNTKNRLELTYGSKNSFQIYSDKQRTYVKFLITGRTA